MRRPGRLLAVVAALALSVSGLVASGPEPSSAAGSGSSNSERNARIRELQRLVGEASAAEREALAELVDVRERRAALDAEVARLDRQVANAEQAVAEAEAEVARVGAAYTAATERAQAADAALAEGRARLQRTVASLYRTAGDPTQAVPLFLDAETPRELLSGARYLSDVTDQRQAIVDDLTAAREEAERQKAALDSERIAAMQARDAADAERQRLDGLRAQQAQARAGVAAEEQREQQVVASIRARKDSFTSELARLQAESNAISRQLAQRQANQQPSGRGPLLRPVSGAVTSPFGPRVHPILGDARMHNGIDMAASTGTPVKAAAAGTVVFAGTRGGYGRTVIIDHGNTLATLYAHLSSIAVSSGATVRAGQVVGAAGASGLATGPHLHFEVRVRGVPVNPLSYL